MSQAGNQRDPADTDSQMNTGIPNEHLSPQQRAGEIAYMLQQAHQECLADIERVEDDHAQELFGRVAALLNQAIDALYSYQDGHEDAAQRLKS